MANSPASLPQHSAPLDGAGKRIAIIYARWHTHITAELVAGAQDVLLRAGMDADDIDVFACPGSYELPVAASAAAETGRYDAVIAFGVVIRGETAHFEYVASPVAHGLQEVAVQTGVPCIFGVLTTETEAQAMDRIGGAHGHKGREAAASALEIIDTVRSIYAGIS